MLFMDLVSDLMIPDQSKDCFYAELDLMVLSLNLVMILSIKLLEFIFCRFIPFMAIQEQWDFANKIRHLNICRRLYILFTNPYIILDKLTIGINENYSQTNVCLCIISGDWNVIKKGNMSKN